jgi:hypothetical protein
MLMADQMFVIVSIEQHSQNQYVGVVYLGAEYHKPVPMPIKTS